MYFSMDLWKVNKLNLTENRAKSYNLQTKKCSSEYQGALGSKLLILFGFWVWSVTYATNIFLTVSASAHITQKWSTDNVIFNMFLIYFLRFLSRPLLSCHFDNYATFIAKFRLSF
jgi:hypothetical protein